MGKGSKGAKQQVTDYRLTVQFGVSLGPVDYVRGVRINEKPIWSGQALSANGPQSFGINNPYLFGGPQKEGGVEGLLWVLPGRGDQLMPSALASRQGKTPATCVAYRGITSIYLTGSRQGEGFMWSTNNPIVATTVEVEVTRSAKGLDPALGLIDNPDYYGAPDANPAHIIYEAATDPVDGIMRVDDMDYASFNAAAQTIFNEQMGMTILWVKPMKVEDFINEVQGHINAVSYVDPETGKLTIKLIRDDYNPAELFEINADNAELVDFQRKFLGETVNEIVATYTDPRNEEDATLTVHDLASAQTQGVVSDSRNFYGFRRADITETAAWRELLTANAPLASVNVLMNREGWNLRPGQPVRVYFPADNPDDTIDIIARVGEIDYGETGSEDIPLGLVEDVFSLLRPPNTRATDTAWVDESEPPSPMAAQQVFTLPSYMVLSSQFQESAPDLEYPEVLAAVLGHHPSPDALSFDLLDAEVQPTGELELTSGGVKTLTERGTLLQSLAPEATTDILWSTLSLGRGPRVGGFALIGTAETTQEIVLIRGFDGYQWTVDRGVLDTVPGTWATGTPVWFLNPNSRFVDDRTVRSAGEDVTYRLLTRTSQGQLDVLEAPPITATLTDRPHRPLRPANVAVNGVPITGAVNVAAVDDIEITWATRNRVLEDGQVVPWGAAPVAPEYKQRTVVLVTDLAGTEIRRYVHLWTENTLVLPKLWFALWPSVKVYVYAERDGLPSLQVLGFTVNGLANDAGAALPPVAPDEGVPPPPILEPGVGAFTAAGGLTDSATGAGRIPAIIVQGRRDNPEALALVVRYKVSGTTDWQYHPAATLDERDLNLPIPVSSNTTYDPEVAYVSGEGIVGKFRALAPVTSGTLVADNATNADALGNRQALEVLADIDGAYDAVAAAELALNTAVNALDVRVQDVELDIDDPTTGLKVRVGTNETATADNASRVTVVENSINTPTTGLTARTASLETATSNLALTKADASALTIVEASVKGFAASVFPRDFQNDGTTWTQGYGGLPANRVTLAQLPAYTFPTVASVGKVAELTNSAGAFDVMTVGNVTLRPSRRYRLTTRARCTSATNGTQYAQPLAIMLSQAGGGLKGISNTGEPALTQNIWQTVVLEFLSDDHTYADVFQYGVRFTGAGTFQFASADLEDVTDDTALSARATSLETATADLTTGKADASRVAIVEARAAGAGYATLNPQFSDWPSGTYPAGWGAFGIDPTKVGVLGASPWAMRFDTTGASTPAGTYNFSWGLGNGWYAVTLEATLEAGTFAGVGVLFRPVDAGANTLGTPADVYLSDRPDDNNPGGALIGAGVVGRTYRVTILVDLTAYTSMAGVLFYGITDGYFTSTPKKVLLRTVGARRATADEVEARNARGGFASLSARAASVDSAVVDLQTGKADASRVTVLEARAGGANLLSKGQWFTPSTSLAGWGTGNAGLAGWLAYVHPSPTTGPGAGELPLVSIESGAPNPGYYREFGSPLQPVKVGQRYCFSSYAVGAACDAWVFVTWHDAAGAYIGYSGLDNGSARASNEGTVGALSNWKRIHGFGVAPAGAISASVVLRKYSTTSGTYSEGWFLRPMLSEATSLQTEAPAWSPAALEARVVTQEAATTDLYGRTYARWANGTAVPGAATFIYAQSEVTPGAAPTSDVGIGAKVVSIFNESGGDWKKALEVAGGNVVMTGSLQVGATIRLGNGTGWPVALKAVDYSATDGGVVSFGTNLGGLPALTFATNNLAPLTAGESYDVKATGLTATGFTLSAKINVPGTPVTFNKTGGTATTAFGAGGYKIDKTADANSSDSNYRITASGTNRHQFYGMAGSGEPDYDFVTGTIQVWAKKAGVWAQVTTVSAGSIVWTGDYTSGIKTVAGTWNLDTTLQFGDGVQEVGLRHQGTYTQDAVTAFSNLRWTAPGTPSGTRSATPSGQATTITVRPQ